MYRIDINTKTQILTLYRNGFLVKQYPVAVGKPSTPSPIGHWILIRKGLWGKQFGGHFMQLNVPGGIYGIHGTDIPASISHDVSHGCIRMYSNSAKELYAIVPIGTSVNIF
jgi:lipoprotein-anchoring transpeptidase ErfK/SrfK